jgi:hypothetical protein
MVIRSEKPLFLNHNEAVDLDISHILAISAKVKPLCLRLIA